MRRWWLWMHHKWLHWPSTLSLDTKRLGRKWKKMMRTLAQLFAFIKKVIHQNVCIYRICKKKSIKKEEKMTRRTCSGVCITSSPPLVSVCFLGKDWERGKGRKKLLHKWHHVVRNPHNMRRSLTHFAQKLVSPLTTLLCTIHKICWGHSQMKATTLKNFPCQAETININISRKSPAHTVLILPYNVF